MTAKVERASDQDAAKPVLAQLQVLHNAIMLALQHERDLHSAQVALQAHAKVVNGTPEVIDVRHAISMDVFNTISTPKPQRVAGIVGRAIDDLTLSVAKKLINIAGNTGGFELTVPPNTHMCYIAYRVGAYNIDKLMSPVQLQKAVEGIVK
jgi:hypothetical protein